MITERESKESLQYLLTLSEVKELLQIGYGRILQLIDSGQLEAYSLDDTDPRRAVRVLPSSLERYLEQHKI